MRRRELLLVFGSVVLWPHKIRAQQPLPVIGFLHPVSLAIARPEISAFWRGLEQAGFTMDRNVAVTYRFAEGHEPALPNLAMDLVGHEVAVIVTGDDGSVAAAKAATRTIPIVFISGSDPILGGLVSNLNHPEDNVTGVSLASTELLARRLEILHQLTPNLAVVTALVNPENSNIAVQLQYLTEAAKRIGVVVKIINAARQTDFDAALDKLADIRGGALLVSNDGFLNSQRDRLVKLTMHKAIPAAFGNREFVEAGGLMSYGPSAIEAYQQAGIYVGRILKGEKPADLPIEHPIAFELVINVTTAKSLGLKIPAEILAVSDKVIE